MKSAPPAPGTGRITVGWRRRAPSGWSRWPRRLAAVALATLAILAIAWSGYWLLLTSRLEAGVHQWIAGRRAQGYEIGYVDIARGGFPLSAHVVLTNPALAMPANAPPLAWSAARLVVGVDPFQPRRLYIDSPGAHALGVGRGLDQVRYHAEARHLRMVPEIGEAAPASALPATILPATILNVRDLVLKPLAGDIAGPGREALTIARLDARGRRVPSGGDDAAGESYNAVVNAAGIAFSPRLDPPLGHVVQRMDADVTVQGELALTPWPQALLRWRDEGGVLDVAALRVNYGALNLSGSGTAALDEAGQPVAAFAAQVSGLFQLIDALRARGDMGRGEAIAAKLALGVLGGTPDRQAPLNLPLTLQDRVLSVGPVALTQIPEIHWLAPPPR
jgi:Uncharacterized protein conserved in bacteria (DUF2125)